MFYLYSKTATRLRIRFLSHIDYRKRIRTTPPSCDVLRVSNNLKIIRSIKRPASPLCIDTECALATRLRRIYIAHALTPEQFKKYDVCRFFEPSIHDPPRHSEASLRTQHGTSTLHSGQSLRFHVNHLCHTHITNLRSYVSYATQIERTPVCRICASNRF